MYLKKGIFMKAQVLAAILTLMVLSGCDNLNQSEKKEIATTPKVVQAPTLQVQPPQLERKSFDLACQNQTDYWYKKEAEALDEGIQNAVDAIYKFYSMKSIVDCKNTNVNGVRRLSCYGVNGNVDISLEEESSLIKQTDWANNRAESQEYANQKNELKEIYLTKSKFCSGLS